MPAENKPQKFKSLSFNKESGKFEATETDAEPLEVTCSIDQPFRAVLWARESVGHVMSIKIAGAQLAKDLKLYDPLAQNLSVTRTYPKVTGVIEKMTWAGGYEDTITIDFYVTASNWQKASNVEFREDGGAADDQDYEEVELDFCVYEWDSVEQMYFKSFHSNDVALKGVFRFNNSDYKVQSKLSEAEENRSPQIYKISMIITPPPAKKQDVFIGVASEATLTKPWGDDSLESKALATKDAADRLSRKAMKREEEEARRESAIAEQEERRMADLAKNDRETYVKEREEKRLAELADQQLAWQQKNDELREKAAKAAEAAAAAAAHEATEAGEEIKLKALEQELELLENEREGLKADFDARRKQLENEREDELVRVDKALAKAKLELHVQQADAYKGEAGVVDKLMGLERDWRSAKEFSKGQQSLADEARKIIEKCRLQIQGINAAARPMTKKQAEELTRLEAEIVKQEGLVPGFLQKKASSDATVESLASQIRPLKQQLENSAGERAAKGLDAATAEGNKELDDERRAIEATFDGRVKAVDDEEAAAATELDAKIAGCRERIAIQDENVQKMRQARIESTGSARTGAQLVLLAKVEAKAVETEQAIMPRVNAAAASAERAAIQAEVAVAGAKEAVLAAERQLEWLKKLDAEVAKARLLAAANSQSLAEHDFHQEVSILLKLTIDGKATDVGGGSVTRFDIAVETWGFTGEIEFLVSLDAGEDTLNASFTGTKLCEVEVALKSKFQPETNPPDPLKLKGIAIERRVVEDSYDALADKAVLRRRYFLSFADPASVLWKQHRPTELFNEKKLQDVVDAHKGAKITITGDWTGHWDKVKPFIFIGLGDRHNKASFHDFLIWYLERNRGNLVYDTTTNAYKVLGTKPADGTAKKLDADDIEELRIVIPEVPRHTANILNGWTEAATKKAEITFDAAVTGIRQDHLVITDITTRFDARKTLETARLVARLPEVHIRFARIPTVTFSPGGIMDFTSKGWATGIFSKSKVYRVRSYHLTGRASSAPDGKSAGSNFGAFDMKATAVMEEKTDTAPHLPPYETPRWPVLVEGKVVSEQGEETDETYQIYKDKDTSIDQYKVKLPVFADKTVLVDFNPNTFHGHFYFPAFKNARVLLALEYERAWIKRFVDWRPNARLPADSQGNHILLGKSEKSHTTINHVYVDEKPVLNVKRLSDKDTQTIVLKDGTLTIEVKEESE